MIGLPHYLLIGLAVFVLGMVGFFARRNLIVMFLSVEMMLQGVAINLIAFARYHGNLQGQAFTLFMITVAACEAALALSFIVLLYRSKHSLDVMNWQALRDPGQEAFEDDEPVVPTAPPEPLPQLPVAGRAPQSVSSEDGYA
jgi:NADH-quinone oxidoreductase subunit K